MAKFRFRLRCFGCHSVLLLVASLLVICFAYFGSSCPLRYDLSPFSCRTLATTERDDRLLLLNALCSESSSQNDLFCPQPQCTSNVQKANISSHRYLHTLHSVRKSLERTSRFCSHRMFWTEPPWTCIQSMLVKQGDSWLQKWSNMTRSCIFMIALRSTQLTPQAVVHFVTQLAKAREVAEEWCYFIWFDFCNASR